MATTPPVTLRGLTDPCTSRAGSRPTPPAASASTEKRQPEGTETTASPPPVASVSSRASAWIWTCDGLNQSMPNRHPVGRRRDSPVTCWPSNPSKQFCLSSLGRCACHAIANDMQNPHSRSLARNPHGPPPSCPSTPAQRAQLSQDVDRLDRFYEHPHRLTPCESSRRSSLQDRQRVGNGRRVRLQNLPNLRDGCCLLWPMRPTCTAPPLLSTAATPSAPPMEMSPPWLLIVQSSETLMLLMETLPPPAKALGSMHSTQGNQNATSRKGAGHQTGREGVIGRGEGERAGKRRQSAYLF